jgi:hypothetical protein
LSTADLVFGACLVLGGGLLLLTLIFDDIFGGLLNVFHLGGLDFGGVSPTPVVLGFLAMFGIGGLFGVHSLGLGTGLATLIGGGAGIIGGGVVLGAFKVLAGAESTESFSLQEMVGSSGRVSVGIPANRYGRVLISFAGASHNMGATADTEIPAGRIVTVVGIAGSNLVVESPSVTSSTQGAPSDA